MVKRGGGAASTPGPGSIILALGGAYLKSVNSQLRIKIVVDYELRVADLHVLPNPSSSRSFALSRVMESPLFARG